MSAFPTEKYISYQSDKLLFVSDVHLGGFSEKMNNKIEAELIHLVDYAEDNSFQLIILGDLFDYWMEYPETVPDIGKNVTSRLKHYNENHEPVLYITGNHDNWDNGYFSQMGFEPETNYRILQLKDKEVLLMHGDGVADSTINFPRPLIHKILRSDTFIDFYQKIFPPQTGFKIMKKFSRINRRLRANSADLSKLENWAEGLLENSGIDTVICGHDHTPRTRIFSFGTFINLGTFYQHRTVATYNNGRIQLVVWNDDKRQLTNIHTFTEQHG